MTTPIVKIPTVTVDGTNQVLYALQPKQYEVYSLTPVARGFDDPGPCHIGCGGSAGGGKSWLSDAILVAVALAWPGSSSIIFRRTEKEIKTNHVNKIRSQIPEEINGVPLYSWNGEDMCMTWANGSRTYFGFLRTDDDVFTYQGGEYDHINFEEATHYSEFQVTWMLNRLRVTVAGARWKPFAVYPSNPGSKGHIWYKRRFIQRVFREQEDGADYAFVQMFLKDNQELLQRDPGYVKKLNTMPEPWRSWMRDGNWAAGAGAAFPDLSLVHHVVQPFEVPDYWKWFGSFDWGYNHPWSFGLYAVNEDGRMFCVDSRSGYHMSDHAIADSIRECVGERPLGEIVAGRDCWNVERAHGAMPGPTVADLFAGHQLFLVQADIARVNGYRQVRLRLQGTEARAPNLVWFDTPQNRRVLTCLESMITSERNPEDVLKVDADEYGENGDDDYDQVRYACNSEPLAAAGSGSGLPFSISSSETLAAEHDRLYRRRADARVETLRKPPPAFHDDWE